MLKNLKKGKRMNFLRRFDRDKGNKGGWRPFDQKLQKARNHAAMVSVSDRAADCS